MTYRDPELHFLWMEVTNLAQAVWFYREVLGFPVQDDTANLAVVHLANSKLYLAPGAPRGVGLHIALAVDDIDRMAARLRAHNVNVPDPVDEGWARHITFNDPEGYRLILLQPTTEEPAP
ncbi:MAG: VOC family protein [Caldilineales bacterium]|nr:VOC family protein [Caldilineales bacterium]